MPAHPYRLSRLRHLLIGGLAGLTLCADSGVLAADGTAAGATVRVTVFDYAALPAANLNLILATVEQLLGNAGLRVRWALCSPGATPWPSVCRAPLGQDGLALRLLAAAPPVSHPDAPLTLGFAVLDEAGAGDAPSMTPVAMG